MRTSNPCSLLRPLGMLSSLLHAAPRAGLGMADGAVILGPNHPLVLEAISLGQDPVVFPRSSKDVSVAADPTKETASEYRNLLGE